MKSGLITAECGRLTLRLEGRMPAETAAKLGQMGHKVKYEQAGWGEGSSWGEGSVTAVGFSVAEGGGRQLFGAANPRGSSSYAVGR